MPALPPFAALEARSNAAVIANLSNALVTFGAAPAVWCVFENDYIVADAGGGMAATHPVIKVATAHVPAGPIGHIIVIEGRSGPRRWRIAEHHPDGTGLSILFLEAVA